MELSSVPLSLRMAALLELRSSTPDRSRDQNADEIPPPPPPTLLPLYPHPRPTPAGKRKLQMVAASSTPFHSTVFGADSHPRPCPTPATALYGYCHMCCYPPCRAPQSVQRGIQRARGGATTHAWKVASFCVRVHSRLFNGGGAPAPDRIRPQRPLYTVDITCAAGPLPRAP